MTARQRQASGSAAVLVPAEERSPTNGSAAAPVAAFRWEQWFAAATADQRAEALARAREQGLLYLHQLPPAVGKPGRTAEQPSAAPLLCGVLAGKVGVLPPPSDEPLEGADPQLDPLQREAVRRALNTPDVSLLLGLPGTGKSRVVAEAICQAARRGWRVLFLAPAAEAVDAVLERLADRPDVLPIRLLGPDESADALPAWLRALTLPEQQRAFQARSLEGARRARRQAEETCQRRRREEELWPELLRLAEQDATLGQRLDAVRQRQAEVPGQVEREAAGFPNIGKGLPSGPFASELIELHRRTAQAVAEWQAAHKVLEDKQDARRKELAEIDAAMAAVEPKCRARRQGRWWTPAYWTAASALSEQQALAARRDRAEAARREVEEGLAALAEGRRQIDEKAQAERRDLVRAETDRRRQELAAQEATLLLERERLGQKWRPLTEALDPAELRPTGTAPPDVEAARQRWQDRRRRDEEGSRFARQWADYLDEAGEQLLPRLPALANLLAGPTAAAPAVGPLGAATAAPFDLLIVEEAGAVTESELLRLAAYAPRLMLVCPALGEPAAPAPPARGPRTLHGLQPLAACWPRLWQALADDLGRIPYTWERRAERLVCQLVAVRPDDARYLETEGLADAPEIELHILNRPRGRPVLARVTFPAAQSIAQATAFIYRELQELPVQPLGRSAWWEPTADAWVLHLGPVPPAATDAADLGDGVRLGLVAEGHVYAGRAARLEFARGAGWDRERARQWLAEHLHWRDRDRSTVLQVPYRLGRPLADVVGPVLFPGECLAGLLAPGDGAFEFVAVPPPRRPEWPREGAGLEQDLAAGRHGDRLPAELRAELPRQGLVNYLEAQALVGRLEQWARDPAELRANGKGMPAVLVLALYDAQAELIRRLVERSEVLRSRPFPLEVAGPPRARQRECDVLVLSLTRSHAHRCVPFGEGPADLALALTRPRRRLLVFGDPGTLVKRSGWHGPLDHLDAPEAHLEGQRLGRLVAAVCRKP
jgi:hypothetical protein